MQLDQDTRLHVRFDGRSEELLLADLDLRADVDDATLWSALARRYQCPVSALEGYVIVRESQAIIIRPLAFYG
ncbi:MAG TPA: hypothetical protein VFS21_15060 [Roseiflexaceae bacterium]|nr:hypothetical protein [Roseiflexaceae bacterium]